MRNIIRCLNCEANGLTRNLAEILPTGFIKIQRFHKDMGDDVRESTVLAGNDFTLICGQCGQMAFRKEVYDLNIWQFRFPRFTVSQSIVLIGTSNSQGDSRGTLPTQALRGTL